MVVWESLDALSHQLELCGIDGTTQLVVLTGAEVDSSRMQLVRAAAARTGADAVAIQPVRVDPHDVERVINGPLVQSLLDRADFVIDCMGRSRDDSMVVHDGLRVLELLSTAPEPRAFPPHANMRTRVERLSDILESALVLTLSDTLGTQLRINVGWSSVSHDHGMVSKPGTRGTFPSGWVKATTGPGSVEGDIVIMPGDGNVSVRCAVNSPVRLRIRNDMITSIDGDSPDADVVRAVLEESGEPNAYGFAAITIGMNPGVRAAGAPFDPVLIDPDLSRLTAGVITIAFGNNPTANRPSETDLTVALSRRSLTVDDLPIVAEGRLQGDCAPDVYESPSG